MPSSPCRRGLLFSHRNICKNCSKITKFIDKFSISACGMGVDFCKGFRLYLCLGQNMTWSTGRTFGKNTRRPRITKRTGLWMRKERQCICFFMTSPGVQSQRESREKDKPDADLWSCFLPWREELLYSTLLSLSTF